MYNERQHFSIINSAILYIERILLSKMEVIFKNSCNILHFSKYSINELLLIIANQCTCIRIYYVTIFSSYRFKENICRRSDKIKTKNKNLKEVEYN